ncbi:hypothetical protein ACOMHN_045935 [Nucella lapillus]
MCQQAMCQQAMCQQAMCQQAINQTTAPAVEARLGMSDSNCKDLEHQASSPLLLSVTERAAIGSCMVLICWLSLLGNSIFWLVVLRYRVMRSMVNILLLSLSAGGFLEAALTASISTHSVIMGKVSFGCSICKFMAYAVTVTDTVCLASLCALSVNRYVRICRPYLYHTIYNRASIGVHIFGIWGLACLWASMPLLGWGQYVYAKGMFFCYMEMINSTVLRIVRVVLIVAVMLIVICCYIAIFYRLSRKKANALQVTRIISPMCQKISAVHKNISWQQRTGSLGVMESQLYKRLSAIEEITDSEITNDLCSFTKSSNPHSEVPKSQRMSVATTSTTLDERVDRDSREDATSRRSSYAFSEGSSLETDEIYRYHYGKRFSRSLLVVTFAYWLSILPIFHFTIVNKSADIAAPVKVAFLLVYHLNGVINPILYGWGNNNIRTGYKRFFRKLLKCKHCKCGTQVEPG